MVRPMVHSTKHYVQPGLRSIVAGVTEAHVIVEAVAIADVTDNDEVGEGNSVKAIYVESWIRASGASPGAYIAVVAKVPGTGTTFGTTQMAALFDAENKKNILFTSQALVNDNDANAINIIRGWLKVPKSKQRMGLGDRWVLHTNAIGVDMTICGFETYKEYT